MYRSIRAWAPEYKLDDEVIPAHMVFNPSAGASITKTREFINEMTMDKTTSVKVYINDIFKEGAGNYIWMQYTGLKDLKDVEIFEGDLIAWPTKTEGVWSDQSGKVMEVKYPFICGNAHLGLVIGNIHENPDLIIPSNERN